MVLDFKYIMILGSDPGSHVKMINPCYA